MKEKFYQFMQGRYGVDQLNIFLMIVSIICFIIEIILKNMFFSIGAYILWFILIFRMLSKNIYVRNQENEKYLNLINPLTNYYKCIRLNKDNRDYKHFICKKCKQVVRVPKGHGKIIINCPSCKNKFEKRS